jgi:hypothetical protein
MLVEKFRHGCQVEQYVVKMIVTVRTHRIRITVEPWIASIIRSRNVLVIQNTRISK